MSEINQPVVFSFNGQEIAKIGADGKLLPAQAPIVRLDQIDNRSDIGKQAWIDLNYGSPSEPKSSI